MPGNHFKDVKKVVGFTYVGGEGGVLTNKWKIPYVFCRSFLKASIICLSISHGKVSIVPSTLLSCLFVCIDRMMIEN